MENLIDAFVFTHAVLGGIALVSGFIPLITKKGGRLHRTSGRIFFFSMLASVILAIAISIMPGHENLFLLSIGILSVYFLVSGMRSIFFGKKYGIPLIDKIISLIMLGTGLLLILIPISINGFLNPIIAPFALIGILFAYRDLKLYRSPDLLIENRVRLHLGKMTGGYIAAVTAFFVVNQILPGILNWLLPTLIGSVYIAYWRNRLKPGKKHTSPASA